MKRFQDTDTAKYDLSALPDFVLYQYDGKTCPEGIKWGVLADNAKAVLTPPVIGSRVHVAINGMGTGTVESYFVEHNWLGVCVKLDSIPEWKRNQQDKDRAQVALVFGPELRQV